MDTLYKGTCPSSEDEIFSTQPFFHRSILAGLGWGGRKNDNSSKPLQNVHCSTLWKGYMEILPAPEKEELSGQAQVFHSIFVVKHGHASEHSVNPEIAYYLVHPFSDSWGCDLQMLPDELLSIM